LKLNTINTLISQNKTLSNQTACLCKCISCKTVNNCNLYAVNLETQARIFIKIADKFGNQQTFADLDYGIKVLGLLSQDNTPQEAIKVYQLDFLINLS